MDYLSIFGPVESLDEPAFIPLLMADDAPPRLLEPATSFAGALFTARRALGSRPVVFDESVVLDEVPAGWRRGRLPEGLARLLAITAVAVNSGEAFARLKDGPLVDELVTSIVAFARARPWRRFPVDKFGTQPPRPHVLRRAEVVNKGDRVSGARPPAWRSTEETTCARRRPKCVNWLEAEGHARHEHVEGPRVERLPRGCSTTEPPP